MIDSGLYFAFLILYFTGRKKKLEHLPYKSFSKPCFTELRRRITFLSWRHLTTIRSGQPASPSPFIALGLPPLASLPSPSGSRHRRAVWRWNGWPSPAVGRWWRGAVRGPTHAPPAWERSLPAGDGVTCERLCPPVTECDGLCRAVAAQVPLQGRVNVCYKIEQLIFLEERYEKREFTF